ncbi:MAG TPA: carotenoid oxygenase family protein [Solirubrobacteraceae bacterium]
MATTSSSSRSELDGPEVLRRGLREQRAEIAVDDVPVTGQLPAWLTGTLVRLSPSRWDAGEQQMRHWFDGLAMLHRFGIRDGRVDYANRFLRTKQYRSITEEGHMAASEFGTDPCRTLFGRVMTMFRPDFTDNANVNVVRLAGEAIAMTETPIPMTFDPETLETIGVSPWAEHVPGVLTIAHPHADPVSGDLVSFATEISRHCKVNVYRMDPQTRETTVIASIPDPKIPYMHSFAITDRHVILVTFPLVIDQLAMMKGALKRGGGVVDHFRWEPERGSTFHVFDRETGEQRAAIAGPAFFSFHHVNAFEREDGRVVVDLFAYQDGSIVEALMIEDLRAGTATLPGAELQRCELDLDAGTVDIRPLAEPNAELGRIDYARRNGRPYRWLYAVSSQGTRPGAREALLGDQLVKIDVDSGAFTAWHEPGCLPSEPVFVARPGGTDEDDGVALSVVLDGRSETSFLLALDAATFTEVARAALPQHVPLGFHGAFFSV